MCSRKVFAGFLIAVVSFALAAPLPRRAPGRSKRPFMLAVRAAGLCHLGRKESPTLRSQKHSHDGDRCRFGQDSRGHSRPEA